MRRGEIWLAQVGGKRRPVLILTRSEVIAVRALVTVAEVTTSMRGLTVEVPIDHHAAGIDQESAVNCDGVHTVPQALLTERVGSVGPDVIRRVCDAVGHALGC